MIKQNQISKVGAGVALQYTAKNQTTPTAAIAIEKQPDHRCRAGGQ